MSLLLLEGSRNQKLLPRTEVRFKKSAGIIHVRHYVWLSDHKDLSGRDEKQSAIGSYPGNGLVVLRSSREDVDPT